MAIQINEISEKYINKLGKSYFNTVKLSEAASSIKMAVKETAEAAKKEIESAVKPLSDKITQKDEFISALQEKLDINKSIINEAYKQNITQEIRDKKNGLALILSGLIHHKKELNKPKTIEKSVVEAAKNIEEKPVFQKTEKSQKPKVVSGIKKQNQIKRPVISPKIIKEIEAQRKNQKLDKARLDKASVIIRTLLEDTPQKDTYSSVQDNFKKTMNRYLDVARSVVNGRYSFVEERFSKFRNGKDENGKILLKEHGIGKKDDFHPYKYEIFNQDGSSVEFYDGMSDSYIEFRDTNGKQLLKLCYSDHYSAFISDKNGRLMVSESIRDGVVKYLNVNFNEVRPIATIENDEQMNAYAQELVSKAKIGCKPKQKEYNDTTDIDYINPEGKTSVHEYFVNKKRNPNPVFTYLYDTKDGQLNKLITDGDFGIHAKYDEKKRCFVQYSTKGITGIDKIRKNSELKDFRMGFYKSTENEHFEVQSLYDKNYTGDKDSILQREVYEKRNYGLASKPLTQSFTFHDLTKHKIKPWDFSILKSYL